MKPAIKIKAPTMVFRFTLRAKSDNLRRKTFKLLVNFQWINITFTENNCWPLLR